VDSRYLELLESERFGPTRSLSEHLASLEQERATVYRISSEPSTVSVEFWREYMWRKEFSLPVRRLANQLRKEQEYGKN
jgi:hypothetical protein